MPIDGHLPKWCDTQDLNRSFASVRTEAHIVDSKRSRLLVVQIAVKTENLESDTLMVLSGRSLVAHQCGHRSAADRV